jgi:CubicO group peptidase (beta-lactamase class C family)
MTTRRALIGQGAALLALGGGARAQPTSPYDGLVGDFFAKSDLMGLQVAVIEKGRPAWSGAYGLADAQHGATMTTDTVVNIASVSKTVTAAAVLRLVERKKIDLDGDVNSNLPFAVRNPLYDGYAITVRQLLAHISSVADRPAYAQSYACGPSQTTLKDWLATYFAAKDRSGFHPWPPGQKFAYSNVGFGLLGLIIETVSGKSFAEFCDAEIFKPLAMTRTGVGEAKDAPTEQAVDYTLTVKADRAGRIMPARGALPVNARGQGYIENCAYSFPDAPDGLVRTSVTDFARFVAAIAGGGALMGTRLLHTKTLDEMFSEQFARAQRPADWPVAQGLAWSASRAPDGGFVWQLSGADPGVGTLAMLHRSSNIAVVLFTNTAPAEGLDELAANCLQLAAQAHKQA